MHLLCPRQAVDESRCFRTSEFTAEFTLGLLITVLFFLMLSSH